MCFFTSQSKQAVDLEHRFKANFAQKNFYTPSILINGFQNPRCAIIQNNSPAEIKLSEWGLIPTWAKDRSFQKNTLNAKVEALKDRPTYKNYVNNKCLVLVDGFYEWQWLDEKGTKKQKYLITNKDQTSFAFAGLWNEWQDKYSGEVVPTFTILTTEANELMKQIHNSKMRMPICLTEEDEYNWLHNKSLTEVSMELVATKV
jgi:putative SOS response-associated peptidase YedK